MKVINKNKKNIISENAIVCSTYLKKARGLMFSNQKDLIFVQKKEEKVPLHMWFVFFPIDVVYLNNKKRVVEIKENFMPFTFYFPKQKAQYVLELAQGSIQKTKIQIKDYLLFG
ncbi:MAG: DUF192 domain-containing protein [Candidatus Woesearchaeota archaeon]|jgi:hypothetical protein